MLVKSKKRYHLAVEMLKWWSYRSGNRGKICNSEASQARVRPSGSSRSQKFCRRRRPRGSVQLYAPANFPNSSANGKEDPWKSAIADEDYFTGRKLLRIIETSTLSIKTVETVVCFLCQFEDNTFRFIPREAVRKHDPMAVIHYFESMIAVRTKSK